MITRKPIWIGLPIADRLFYTIVQKTFIVLNVIKQRDSLCFSHNRYLDSYFSKCQEIQRFGISKA